MSYTISNSRMAALAINKSLLKEYNDRVVYMNDGDEFQVQLYNNTNDVIGAKIWMNNSLISSSYIVIRPGERIWLDRYIDTPKKFKFVTYNVDNTEENKKAIENNGTIKVSFYHKYHVSYTPSIYTTNNITIQPLTQFYTGDTISACASFETSESTVSSMETGRVEKGSRSEQVLSETSETFEYMPFNTETLHIIPKSQKPIHSKDLQKIYCPYCGRKIKTKFKYCPYCGKKQ